MLINCNNMDKVVVIKCGIRDMCVGVIIYIYEVIGFL